MKIDLNAMGYDELLAHGDAVMEAIKKRTFQEGFQAAKQVQRKLAKMKTSINTQARRDEIVEQAKADVRNLVIHGLSHYNIDCSKGNETYRVMHYNVEFIADSKERKVTALVTRRHDKNPRHVGRAKAALDDCFNVHIGKAIALRRALGLAVPDEYLNAPQPTEVRVGDVVEFQSVYKAVERALVVSDDESTGEGKIALGSAYADIAKIIDDSREEVGE
ncbi:hypothetical protein U7118_07470 [Bacillus subtilis]|uniref:hypothetical protein n=1 Tax=Bacillus subtilis TaxID=1423 RepID=UPI002B4BF964|nr:hypothetical protein [Bacillus subtilis]MEC0399889.1 hypothetical protein [Bacillus subtilis]WRK89067.1 hypothetical protein U7118_07470 [Bacillus subtilis]